MAKRETQAVWEKRIELCKRSGKRVSNWCEENQVSRDAYYYWHKKLNNKNKKDKISPVFVEVTDKTSEVISDSEISINWRDFTIKVSHENSIKMVTKLLKALGDPTC